VAWNLKKETLGKVALLCNGVTKYPCSVPYDMGWQKASKTYDSLSGQGLVIGYCTKLVVALQNCSKVCLICERHSEAMRKNDIPDVAVRLHTVHGTMGEVRREWRQRLPWNVLRECGEEVRQGHSSILFAWTTAQVRELTCPTASRIRCDADATSNNKGWSTQKR
jgi:hypothetical protein